MSEVQEKVSAWLEKHWQGPHACPICQCGEWAISTDIHIWKSTLSPLLTYNNIPVVIVVCVACGYVLTFNALIMGIDL